MILGVDPGLGHCGWAVVDNRARVVALGTVVTLPSASVDSATDRAQRASSVAAVLAPWVERCDHVAAESISCPRGVAGILAIGLAWGVVAGLAAAMGRSMSALPPKVWQRAVVPSSGTRVDYAQVEAACRDYVRRTGCGEQLDALPLALQNHALDAVGVAVCAHVLSRSLHRWTALPPTPRPPKRRIHA